MPLRFRRSGRNKNKSEHDLDTFSQAWGSTTQWKNTSHQGNNSAARSISISKQSSLPLENASRPLRKPPITPALLNKPLPPLPPEAYAMGPPEKSPLRAQPHLTDHPALRSQNLSTSVAGPSNQKAKQVRPVPPFDPSFRPRPSLLELARRASGVSSDWQGSGKRNLWDLKRRRQESAVSDSLTIALPERAPMVDRGTQTTPSLERPKPGPTTLPPPELKDKNVKHSPIGRRLLQRRSGSSEEGHRTPLWSPRNVLKQDQPVDYFISAVAEEAEDDGGIESQFRAFLKGLRSAGPLSPSSGPRGVRTSDHTESMDSVVTYESRYSPRTIKPRIARRAKSDDHSIAATNVHTSESATARPVMPRLETAPAKLAKKASVNQAGPPASTSRPLPLPLQKLASFVPPAPPPPPRQSRSDSTPVVASPLRKEHMRKLSESPPTASGPGMNFKINRPRAIQLPPRDEIEKPSGSTPVTPADEEEAAKLFVYRQPFLKSRESDEYLTSRRVEQDVPEHFAGSPLCPMSPKHKSGGWGVCPYHGQRRTSSLLTGVDSKTGSGANSIVETRTALGEKDLGTSRRNSAMLDADVAQSNSLMPPQLDTRRGSEDSAHALEARKVSVASSKGWDTRKSSLASNARDWVSPRRSVLDDDALPTGRPTLGRQGSWAVGINDGAVRGFGYEPPMPDPPTPPMSNASSTPDILTPVVEWPNGGDSGHSNINSMMSRDLRNGPNDQLETHATSRPGASSQAMSYGTDYGFPVARRRLVRSSAEEAKVKQNSNFGKQKRGRSPLSQGGRVGISIDSSDSVPRFKMF
jgi:hypothetical protein